MPRTRQALPSCVRQVTLSFTLWRWIRAGWVQQACELHLVTPGLCIAETKPEDRRVEADAPTPSHISRNNGLLRTLLLPKWWEESGPLHWLVSWLARLLSGQVLLDTCTSPDSVLGSPHVPVSLAPHWLIKEEEEDRTMNLKCHALTLVLPAVDFGQFQAYRKR